MSQLRSVENPRYTLFQRELVQTLPRLRGFARTYCGTSADADDAVQLTCERALQRWQQWTGDGALEHWLLKILINAWRDERRYRNVRAGLGATPIELSADGERDAEANLYLDQVRAEILRLPDGQREALLLVVSEGLSYKETAEVLGVPIGTVMSHLARARQQLAAVFGEQDA
jgi:RNA polymerase sigma-70 factor (ECF subfamily)